MIDERYVLEPLGRDGGKRGFRREIDEFLDDNWMTNLFLIALRELQQNSLEPIDGGDQPNWLNFYALAGLLVISSVHMKITIFRYPWFAERKMVRSQAAELNIWVLPPWNGYISHMASPIYVHI